MRTISVYWEFNVDEIYLELFQLSLVSCLLQSNVEERIFSLGRERKKKCKGFELVEMMGCSNVIL